MIKKGLSILFFIAFSLTMSGQAVHYFHCVEVLENGDVLLSWKAPVDEDTFVTYDIYQTTISNPGSFLRIGQNILYHDTSFLHTPSTANQQENLYYIDTDQSGVLPNILSDTLSSIHLTVNSSDPYLAVLDWNVFHDPLLSGSEDKYMVWMHNPQSSFVLIDSTTLTHYELPVSVCRDTLSFKIGLGNDNNCGSFSNIFSAIFADITPPPMPSLDSVSINPFTGEVILGWSESPAGDAGGYVIYQVRSNINDTLDFVFGKGVTSYFDVSFDPCSENRSYAMAAFDTCMNISPGSYDIPQRTILFNEVVFNPCTMVNTLSWTAYINMDPALEGYRIYLSTDAGPWEVHATMPAGITAYEHTDLEPGHTYAYFIRAFSAADAVTSSSCIRELTTWQYLQPTENELENASVENSEYISISMLPETQADVPWLNLYRSTEASGPFELIAELEPQGQAVLYFDDENADVNNQSYYYRSILVDSCGNEVLETNLMRTVLLQGEKTESMLNVLEWNAFEGWPASVDSYEIYRAIDDDGSFDLIGETDASILYFEDDISSLSGEFSMLRYIVRAMDGNDPGLQSWSNEIFFEYTPSIFLPNAFTPGGKNPVFRPVGTFAQFSEYRFDIYNRWGELIFSSSDFGTGWDGSFKGGNAPGGVYVCVISYRSDTGVSNTLKSTFVLIR